MRLFRLLVLAICLVVPVLAMADDGTANRETGAADAVYEALEISAFIDIMREEGIASSGGLADELSGQVPTVSSNAGWQRELVRIYDHARMDAIMRRAFAADFAGAEAAPLVTFFQSPAGKRIVAAEMAARRAFMDPATEEAARARVRRAAKDDLARLAVVDHYIEINDLIENNVMGTLNSQIHFSRGMIESGGIEISEDEMVSGVWAQEDAVREDTEEWLRAFLLMAYEPVSDADLAAHVALSQTVPGQRVNRALFAGFEKLFDEVHHALGAAVGLRITGEDI